MTAKKWAYEDFVEGATFPLGTKAVTAEEIIEFASEFDAQPMHLDEAAGKASILGGLSASGWHTCAMFMRLICDGFLLDSTSQGSPGIDYAKWKKPVLAGDTLTARVTVLSARISKSRPWPRLRHHPQRARQPARRAGVRAAEHRHVPDARGGAMTLDEFFRLGETVDLGTPHIRGRRRSRRSRANTTRSPSMSTKRRRRRACSAASAHRAGIRPRPG